MSFSDIISRFDDLLYTWCLIYMLGAAGIYFTIRTGAAQLRLLPVAKQFGPWAIHVITLSVCMFAFTSIIGNYFYAESNIRFITKSGAAMTIFRIAAAVMVFIGAQNDIDLAWSLADVTMGLEAVVNIIAIFLLSGIAVSCLKDYEKQKAEGRDPVFYEDNIGLNNTMVWKRHEHKHGNKHGRKHGK